MPVTWDFYVKRKRIQLDKWFRFHNITNYNEFLDTLDNNDVIVPLEYEVQPYFVKSKKSSVQKTKNSAGMSVDEEGFLVAEQIEKKKKPVRKRRSSSKTPRKTASKSQ